MNFSRRNFFMLSLSAFAAGCASSQQQLVDRPSPLWPDALDRPTPTGGGYQVTPAPAAPAVPPPSARVAIPAPAAPAGGLSILPRSAWAKGAPNRKELNPMGKIKLITVHHEGWKEVWVKDKASTAALIEHDRVAHIGMFGAGDIGYHYIIDRAGRLWEGRDVRYQGAHVKYNNENNLGVMLLGNFDKQSPSDEQLTTLRDTLIMLRKKHGVPVRSVKTHREFRPTACPGKALQPRVAWMRSSGAIA